jgi:hypothetical protein
MRTNSGIRSESKFRPSSIPMSSANLGALKAITLLFMSFMLVLLLILPTSSPATDLYITKDSGHIPSESLYQYTLPGSANIQIATGTVWEYSGFAYVIDDEDSFFFVDILNDVSFEVGLPAGDQDFGSGIVSQDVDNDGNSEFIIRNFVGAQYYILVVDIDDGTVSQYPMPFNAPVAVGFGNFGGNPSLDVLIKNANNNDDFVIFDLSGNSTLGSFHTDYTYYNTLVGKFASTTEDSIALVNSNATAFQSNLTLIASDGSQIDSLSPNFPIQDLVRFNHLGGLDEIATIQSNGVLVVYSGPTLSPTFAPQIVDPLPSSARTIQVGDFNLDGQEDLVVVSRTQEKAYFRDGIDGGPIREVSGVYIPAEKRQDIGLMDQDALHDLAIGTTDGGLGIIRGADGNFANIEYLIDVRGVGSSYQIKAIDTNGDSRADIICRLQGQVYLLLSDSTPPDLIQMPIDPVHPTMLDDYVTINVQVNEESELEYADIFMRVSGTGTWIQPQAEMYPSHQEGVYYAFIGNLRAGVYEYYMEFQDTFFNTGSAGNSTHPLTFEVLGNFVWKIDKSNTDYVTNRAHQSDIGNLSDGRRVIYTIERASGVDDLTLTQYSAGGAVLDAVTIVNTGNIWEYFEVYTAMLDGDNVADVIVLDYYYKSDSFLGYHLYNGATLALITEGICPYPYKSFNYLGIIDDDNDGYQELLLVSDTSPLSLIKMDSDGTWSKIDLVGTSVPQGYSVINDVSTGEGYIAIQRGNRLIDIHRADDLSFIRSLNITLSAYTNQIAIGLTSRFNAFKGQEEFVAAVNYWDGPVPTGRLFAFDSTTTNVNNTPFYAIPTQDIAYIYAQNALGDATEELFVLLGSGELRLTDAGVSLSTLWSTSVSSATPLSAAVADFDGDSNNEFLLFTDQDELLTSVSFSGVVEWTVRVGEVRNPLVLGDIDMVPGEEIAAYPFASINSMMLGAVRNLDGCYLLDVSIAYSSMDLVQGDSLNANVTVLNIYGDVINDASVYMTAHFMTPEGPAANTLGFYFWEGEGKYSAIADVTWPIGPVDLSFVVDNKFYHVYQEIQTNALVVRSDLHVELQSPEIVRQGTNTTFRAIVFDNVGGVVEGAMVSISIDGVPFPASVSGQRHILYIPEVQLEAGVHFVAGIASHPFELAEGVTEKIFTVQVPTETLHIATDFPDAVVQDEALAAWFNITDAYGHPIIGAGVTLKSGELVYGMVESTTVPGSYRFIQNMTLGIGSHGFDLYVETLYIEGPPARTYGIEVYGQLEPNVFYETRVEAGSEFEIHIFVKDKYGPVTAGTSVSIDINGTIYKEVDTTGNPDYILYVLADFLMGKNNFTVYVNATYATPWMKEFSIRAYADASASASLNSTKGWQILQGERTRLELSLVDWIGRPVSGASVSFFVKAFAYNLVEIGPGLYAVNMSTIGWAPGMYEYSVSIKHEDIQTGDPITGNITILGNLEFIVTLAPEEPTQGGSLLISIFVIDAYGNPVPGLEIFVEVMNMPTMPAEETDQVGLYVVFIEHLPTSEGYGTKNFNIEATGEFAQPATDSDSFYLDVADPDIGVMDTQTAFSFTGISFVLSLIGMFVYFRMSPSLRRAGTSREEMKKSIRRMDRLYMAIVLASALGILSAMGLNSIGDYGGALILTVVLLGSSVLLYGLWLYRDAVAAVMVRGTLSRKRMVAGLWHLFFVPVVIVMILTYGAEIDWFKYYMIDQFLDIGGIRIPTIMTTIFTAYVSSIIIVVVNLYREVSNGLKKLKKMQDANTPPEIIEDEKETMVNRYSSSIRIKFLMFLVVVGAAAVTTMDFLQSYELGVIVLMPVAFLVVIPFISSKIVQAINRASKVTIKKSKTTTEEMSAASSGDAIPLENTDSEIDRSTETEDDVEESEERTSSEFDDTGL